MGQLIRRTHPLSEHWNLSPIAPSPRYDAVLTRETGCPKRKSLFRTCLGTAPTTDTSPNVNPCNVLNGNGPYRADFLADPASCTFFRIDKGLPFESRRGSLPNLPYEHIQKIKSGLNCSGLCSQFSNFFLTGHFMCHSFYPAMLIF